MASSAASAAKRSGSVIPLLGIIGATVVTAGYWGGSWIPTRGQPAERAFAPVSQPWHVKEEEATNKDRVARYKYLYADKKTGEIKEAPPAITSEVHPVKKLPKQLSGQYPRERYDGDN